MKTDEKPDRILIIGLKYGDEMCFEKLLRKYYPRFRAYTYRLIHDQHQAEDILQNVFMKLWMNRLTLDENISIVTYLFVLTRNEILNHIRYSRMHPLAIFKMNRFEHLSPSEIARRLGLSTRTVEKHIELALKTIRGTLGPILSLILFFSKYQS